MTNALRSDVAQRATLGRWLRAQSNSITTPWIAAAQSRRITTDTHPIVPAVDAAIYLRFYQSLTKALETGHYAALDGSVTEITLATREYGYQLNDLFQIVIALKNEIWSALVLAHPPNEAAAYLYTLEMLFQTVLSYLARLFTDLSQREVTQALDQARHELDKIDEAKTRFIKIAAHELKTPLTLIQGYSDMLGRELGDTANDQVQNILIGLANGAKRLLATINDMIAVSMIDSQTLVLGYQLLTLPHIIQMVLNDLKSALTERELKIVYEPAPPDLKSFYADPHRLYQIFDYIITNSIKYTPDEGRITIEIQLLPGAEPFVEVRVIDTGIGIAAEDLPHLFETFYGKTDISKHSSSRTKFKGGGTGLGLSVVKGIVDAHGGKILIESPGHDEKKLPGTTVRILLPLLSQPPANLDRQHSHAIYDPT
jgi:signal transduction histidine kinase